MSRKSGNSTNLLTPSGWTKIRRGHPWLFQSDLHSEVKVPKGVGLWHFGEHWFLVSPQSKIVLRRLGSAARGYVSSDEDFVGNIEQFRKIWRDPLGDLLEDALKRRQDLFPEEVCYRWVFSENDLIPGLVVDRYDQILVAQILTAPIEFFWPVIRERLSEVYQSQFHKVPKILELRTSAVRAKEGLPVESSLSSAEGQWLPWNGLDWFMTPGLDQKTGAFFDQKNNHLKAAHWAKQFRVSQAWDLCTYHGGFALHLAKGGVKVVALDESVAALEITATNAQRNGLASNIETVKSDVFHFLRQSFDQGRRSDLIVLDPPTFTKGRQAKEDALRGLKELNLRAFHCLKRGGLLISCSCAHHVEREDFWQMLQAAAHDARRCVQVLSVDGPSPDHAPLISFNEGNYLQAWFLYVL